MSDLERVRDYLQRADRTMGGGARARDDLIAHLKEDAEREDSYTRTVDEMVELRDELTRLRKALETIANSKGQKPEVDASECRVIARNALKETIK